MGGIGNAQEMDMSTSFENRERNRGAVARGGAVVLQFGKELGFLKF